MEILNKSNLVTVMKCQCCQTVYKCSMLETKRYHTTELPINSHPRFIYCPGCSEVNLCISSEFYQDIDLNKVPDLVQEFMNKLQQKDVVKIP